MSQGQTAFDRAQAAHDAQEAPREHNCAEDGHEWRYKRSKSIDGVSMKEFKCIAPGCGKTCTEDDL